MLKHLRACDDKDKFPRFLPPGTKVAFKTGSVDASKTAAGIIECEQGPVAVCVMTDENEDKRWVADNAGESALCRGGPRRLRALQEGRRRRPGGQVNFGEPKAPDWGPWHLHSPRISVFCARFREFIKGRVDGIPRHAATCSGGCPASPPPLMLRRKHPRPLLVIEPGGIIEESRGGRRLRPAHPPRRGNYDRAQWHKKLKRILDELPGSKPEWDALVYEARALELDPAWVAQAQREEFQLLVRRIVSDRVVTEVGAR